MAKLQLKDRVRSKISNRILLVFAALAVTVAMMVFPLKTNYEETTEPSENNLPEPALEETIPELPIIEEKKEEILETIITQPDTKEKQTLIKKSPQAVLKTLQILYKLQEKLTQYKSFNYEFEQLQEACRTYFPNNEEIIRHIKYLSNAEPETPLPTNKQLLNELEKLRNQQKILADNNGLEKLLSYFVTIKTTPSNLVNWLELMESYIIEGNYGQAAENIRKLDSTTLSAEQKEVLNQFSSNVMRKWIAFNSSNKLIDHLIFWSVTDGN